MYGYGFLKDVKIEFQDSFHVIFGKNEAGKSTILSFIETMLFGFPKRQQLQYIPKSGGVFGGKLIASIHNAGKLVIERVKNREPEESLIFLNDEKLDETELYSLLQRVDRSLFQQLFSTRLDHLREMEKLDEHTLNRFLLGASVSGHLALHEIEADLEAKRMDLFRPQGRKPVLNAMTSELKVLAEKVKHSERLNEAYESKAKEKANLDSQLQKLQLERKQLQTERKFYETFQDVAPLYEKLEMHRYQLRELPDSLDFPEQGVQRLQQLQEKMIELEAERRSLQQRIDKLQKSAPNVEKTWLEHADAVDVLRERSESYQLKLERLFHVTEQIKHAERDIQRFLEQAGSNWTFEMVANADVSLAKAETIDRLSNEINQLSEEYSGLERELTLIQNRLKAAERKAAEIERTLLSNEEKEKLQSLLEKHNQARIEQEKEYLKRMLERYDSELKELQNARIFGYAAFGLVTIATIIVLFLLRTDWIITGTAIAVLGGLALLIYQTDRNRRKKREGLLKLQNKEKRKLTELESERQHIEHIESAKQKWLIDEERRKEWLIVKHNVEELQAEYKQLKSEHDALTAKKQAKIHEAKRWAEKHHIPEFLPVSHWREWFQQLKETKMLAESIQRLESEKATIQQWIEQYEQDVFALCRIFRLSKNDHVTSLLLKLYRLLEEEKAKHMQAENIQRQISEEQKRLDDVLAKTNQYEKELVRLLNQANCETEEQFFKRAKQFAEQQKISEEINHLKLQIQLYCRDERMKQAIEAEIKTGNVQADEKLVEIEHRLEEIEREQSMLVQQKAQLEVEMKAIEDGGEYDDHLQKLEFQKAQFQDYALEWGTYAVALHLLKKTKERFRNERLPKVVRLATEYFAQMTNEKYRSIIVPIDGETFYVESCDGVHFLPHELSRGTQEQLYLSLRFALISAYPSPFPFPILLDDIFVHFDNERREQAFQLLHQLAQTHQIIFFTCHEEIAEQTKGNILKIKKQ